MFVYGDFCCAGRDGVDVRVRMGNHVASEEERIQNAQLVMKLKRQCADEDGDAVK
jgi:hypothetical protein